jgi:hypothetical protein
MRFPSDLLPRLKDTGLDFVVTGGTAGILHGSAHVAHHIDICTKITDTSIKKLRKALKGLHATGWPEKKQPLPAALQINTTWGTLNATEKIVGAGTFETIKKKRAPQSYGPKNSR